MTGALWLTLIILSTGIRVTLETSETASNPSSVRVRLFYESHCPYSQRFITDQLWPTYQKLGKLMTVHLVPFGLATKKRVTRKDGRDVVEIRCHHGTKECLDNVIQTCAVAMTKPIQKGLEFVSCMSASKSPHAVAQTCAKNIGIKWNVIARCVKSRLGMFLFYKMGQKTWAITPPIVYVPYVEVDGQHNRLLQEQATSNLLKVVCSRLGSSKHVNCNGAR